MEVATASLLGSGLSVGGGLISSLINRRIAEENLEYQKKANAENMALTREANMANIQMQRDINSQNIAFQQRENDITRQREDTAVQRAAADMTAAGLSKTLAAGNPASAQGLTAPQAEAPQVQRAQVQALNNQFRYESALQKMNIAQLLQDMAVKDKQLQQSEALNNANINYLNAQADNMNLQNGVFMENFKNEQLFKLSNISVNNSKVALNRAEEKLAGIEGQYRADELRSKIELAFKQWEYYGALTNLNNKKIGQIAYEIANIIANTDHLNEQTKLLVQDIAYRGLQLKALGIDISYAENHGLPVGTTPGGILGGAFNVGTSIGQALSNTGLGSFLFKPITQWQFTDPFNTDNKTTFWDFLKGFF